MTNNYWLVGLATAALSVLISTPAEAQTGTSPIVIKQLRSRSLKTPDYRVQGISGGGGSKTKTWERIELTYDTSKDWLDEVQFTYYALLKATATSQNSQDPFRLLTGTVTNVNVAQGRQHESVMFIHPSMIERYGKVEAVAVLVKINGVTVAFDSYPQSRTRWWEKYPPKGALLNRLQSAFAYHNYDNYEMIKLQQGP